MRHRVLLRRSPYRPSRSPEQINEDGKREAYRKANRKRLVEAAREQKARAAAAKQSGNAVRLTAEQRRLVEDFS